MPTSLHDREQAFEAKFARDEETRFRLAARRDKLFAQWAATALDPSGEQAEGLVKAVLAIPDKPGHDQAVLNHVGDILAAHGKPVPHPQLVARLELALQQAREQLGATLPD